MSRYTVLAKDANFTAVVGWDPPLQTFFASLYKGEETHFLVGADPIEPPVTSVNQLVTLTKEHLEIPDEIQINLLKDQDESPLPSPLQQRMTNIVRQAALEAKQKGGG